MDIWMGKSKSLIAFVVTALLAVAACDDGRSDYTSDAAASSAKHPLYEADYLALGDSYTIGEGVKVGDTFPWQLHVALTEAGFDVGKPLIVARTGWTTVDLLRAMGGLELPEKPYRLVTLLIGVNDQYSGRRVKDFEPDFEKLLDIAIDAAGGDRSRVVVVSIPDYLATPFASGMNDELNIASLQAYNDAIRKHAEARGVKYVEITEGSRAAENDATLLAEDGLHPSGKQYAQWVEAILPAATEAVEQDIDNAEQGGHASEADSSR